MSYICQFWTKIYVLIALGTYILNICKNAVFYNIGFDHIRKLRPKLIHKIDSRWAVT
jgi:hypothetical protein